MKGGMRAIWLGTVLGLTVALFGVMVMFRGDLAWGTLFAIVISGFIGLLICLPLAEVLAKAFLDKMHAVNDGKVSKVFSHAKRLLVQERFEDAIEEFRRAVEEEPENVSLRLEIAEIYSRDLREYDKAIKEYEAALELEMLDSERVSILNRIADIYESSLGNAEMAVQTLCRITKRFAGTAFARRAMERMARIGEGQGISTSPD